MQQTNPLTGKPYARYYRPGAESGAITLEWRGNILEATIRPFRNPRGPRHTIEVNRFSGHVRCSCEAYRRAHKAGYALLTDPHSGWCKHVATFAETLAETVIERNTGAGR
jgi:hypothetical protein